ncbi:MAG: hypothetical protein K0R00_2385 [Herbinix sp.]|jgi:hypothetical protein|nr:hypothetical protein [Herbinix sp.]
MGVFNRKKLDVKKVVNQDKVAIYIDYSKLKKENDFISAFIQEFNLNKDIFVLVNTNMFYSEEKINVDAVVEQIKNELDSKEAQYEEIVIKKNNDMLVFGFAIKKSDKVNTYQIGIRVSEGEFKKVEEIVNTYNHFCYVIYQPMGAEDLFKKFHEVRGEYEELNQLFGFGFYVNHILQKISVTCNNELVAFAEEKINRLVERYN